MKSLKCLEKLTKQKNKSQQIGSINPYRKKIYEKGTETLYTPWHRNSSICRHIADYWPKIELNIMLCAFFVSEIKNISSGEYKPDTIYESLLQ